MTKMSNTPNLSTGFDEKLQLLKQWRDWHWHMHIYYKDILKELSIFHLEDAKIFHKAYRVMIGNLSSAPTIMKGYEDINYGEYATINPSSINESRD